MQKYIQYLDSTFSYFVYGTGKQTVFCFPGYGSRGEQFGQLEPYIGNDFTLISLELPFHYGTRWREHRMFFVSDLEAVMGLITKEENLAEDIWLAGFSLGGRIAINYFQQRPQHIKKLVLLAPDGMHKIFWYWLIVETHFGNFLLRMLNRSSKWAEKLIKFFYNIKAISASMYVMAKEIITYKEERKLLVKRWITFRKMHPDLKKFGENLQKYHVKALVLFGEHDKVIAPATVKHLKKVAPEQITTFTINAGHILLREPHLKEITKLFYMC